MKDMFCIILETKLPKVSRYSVDDIEADLKYFRLKNPTELNDYDFKVFSSEIKAKLWLKRYLKILNSLNNKKICKSRDFPAMLYKRRYMVQTLMGEKMQTYRSYPKSWKPGQYFNLHDQVFFLSVRLTSLRKVGKNSYRYRFKLA